MGLRSSLRSSLRTGLRTAGGQLAGRGMASFVEVAPGISLNMDNITSIMQRDCEVCCMENAYTSNSRNRYHVLTFETAELAHDFVEFQETNIWSPMAVRHGFAKLRQ